MDDKKVPDFKDANFMKKELDRVRNHIPPQRYPPPGHPASMVPSGDAWRPGKPHPPQKE
jgi:hypothetical protein